MLISCTYVVELYLAHPVSLSSQELCMSLFSGVIFSGVQYYVGGKGTGVSPFRLIKLHSSFSEHKTFGNK
jgi:hypothetical protein